MSEIADILEKAAALIEPEGAWTQGALARTAAYRPVDPSEASAVCFCAIGAITKVSGHHTATALRTAADLLFGSDDYGRLGLWNDSLRRIQIEVVQALRKAAAKARLEAALS